MDADEMVGAKNLSPIVVGAGFERCTTGRLSGQFNPPALVVARSWRSDLQELFLFRCKLIGKDEEVGKVDVSIRVEVKVTLIAGVASGQAKVLDE